ncbi:MAG: hypothetical protein AB8G16_00165 [Gammaproteobacteria bacterium]
MNFKLPNIHQAGIGVASLLLSINAAAEIVEIDFDSLPTGAYFAGQTVAANNFTSISTTATFLIGPSGFGDGAGLITISSFGAGDTIFTFDTQLVTINSVTFTGRSNNAPVSFTVRSPLGVIIGSEDTDANWTQSTNLSFGQPIGEISVAMLESEIRSLTIDVESNTIDTDGDGMPDDTDNCVLVENPMQEDGDGDSYGNSCDTDLNNDCAVNFTDLGDLRTEFFTADPVADFNSDGAVNFADLGIMRDQFFGTPGPSGLTDDCDAPGR